MQAEGNAKSRPVYEHLDTAFVSVAALLRYLHERAFVGRIHVLLGDYEADVLLDGKASARAREVDHRTGRRSEGEDVLPRLLIRAREPGGLISVYEGAEETEATIGTDSVADGPDETDASQATTAPTGPLTPEEMEWRDLLSASGEIIAAVERALLSTGANFAETFRAARLELADDFSFLDPSTNRFQYAHSTVRLHARPAQKVYVSGLSECLRRAVEKAAQGGRAGRARERVALELAVLARRRHSQLVRFNWTQQFDRIAGTRVL